MLYCGLKILVFVCKEPDLKHKGSAGSAKALIKYKMKMNFKRGNSEILKLELHLEEQRIEARRLFERRLLRGEGFQGAVSKTERWSIRVSRPSGGPSTPRRSILRSS